MNGVNSKKPERVEEVFLVGRNQRKRPAAVKVIDHSTFSKHADKRKIRGIHITMVFHLQKQTNLRWQNNT